MRNVFDQYDQWENRVTHALLSALNQDPILLKHFLKEIAEWVPLAGTHLYVEEQSLPGERDQVDR